MADEESPGIARPGTGVFREKRPQERVPRPLSGSGTRDRSCRGGNVEYARDVVLRVERRIGVCLGRCAPTARRAFRRFPSGRRRGELASGRHARCVGGRPVGTPQARALCACTSVGTRQTAAGSRRRPCPRWIRTGCARRTVAVRSCTPGIPGPSDRRNIADRQRLAFFGHSAGHSRPRPARSIRPGRLQLAASSSDRMGRPRHGYRHDPGRLGRHRSGHHRDGLVVRRQALLAYARLLACGRRGCRDSGVGAMAHDRTCTPERYLHRHRAIFVSEWGTSY